MLHRKTFTLIAVAAGLLIADTVVDQAKKKIADKKYDDAIALLEPAYKAKPAPDLKKTLADANLAKADSFMNDAALPPRAKYTGALKAYREVLKYDKDNKKAQENISTIEGIYKSMGRPIPQ
jgi:tetratricopeptide (TPR) repeat protein